MHIKKIHPDFSLMYLAEEKQDFFYFRVTLRERVVTAQVIIKCPCY